MLLVAVLAPLGGRLAGPIDEIAAAGAVHARRGSAFRGVDLGEPLRRQLRGRVAKLGGLADGLVVGECDQRMAQAGYSTRCAHPGGPAR